MGATVEVVTDERRGPPPEGWAAFFKEHGGVLLGVATRIVGTKAFLGVSAEDLVGDTMRKLVAAGLPEGANARAYAMTTLKNTIVDLVEQKKRYTDAYVDLDGFVGLDGIEDEIDDALLAEDLRDALAELPDREAHAIREKVMKGRHWSEVAPELDVTTVQGVGKIVNRGLDRIRRMPRFAGLSSDVSHPQAPSTWTGTSSGTTP